MNLTKQEVRIPTTVKMKEFYVLLAESGLHWHHPSRAPLRKPRDPRLKRKMNRARRRWRDLLNRVKDWEVK